MSLKTRIAIIAYGSLINNPGEELGPIISSFIPCVTPFAVEYARASTTRGNAPTLIPVQAGGSIVNARLLLLDTEMPVSEIESMLWRRETGIQDRGYIRPLKPSANNVLVEKIADFEGVNTVLYTFIGANIKGQITGTTLAEFAIQSILQKAGKEKKDGIRYLAGNIKNEIITPLTHDYEQEILRLTATENLEAAIIKLDKERMLMPFECLLPGKIFNHEAIAKELNSVDDFRDKIKIYRQHYGLLSSHGRIYTRDKDGCELERIYCSCSTCQKDDPEFEAKRAWYAPILREELDELQAVLESDLPYIQKLTLWDKIYTIQKSVPYWFDGKECEIQFQAGSTSEIIIENEFYYEQMLHHWYKKKSSIPQYYGMDFEARRAKFDPQYQRALYPEQLRMKWITAIKEDPDRLRDSNAVLYFNRLVDGDIPDHICELLSYQDMFSWVAAKECYLMLSYLEDYEKKWIDTGNMDLDQTGQEMIQNIRILLPGLGNQEIIALSKLFNALLSYAYYCAKQGVYVMVETIKESVFRDNLIQYLFTIPKIAGSMQKESSIAGGRVEVIYQDFIVELKIERETSDRRKLAEKYKKQATAYSSSLNKAVSFLCILDLSPKKNPSAPIRENISLESTLHHGFGDEREIKSHTIMIVIDGGAPVPSKYK